MANLGGISEIAEALGISRQRVAQLRARADFPDPVARIAMGEIWDLDEVEGWLGSGMRRSPGRPRADAQKRVVGDRFELEDKPIKSGGFGDVYRAIDRKTGTPVAVKILKDIASVDDEAVQRFRRELRIQSEKCDHPHIVKIIAHGDLTEIDAMWCAMPLALGSLADQIGIFKEDYAKILDLTRQLCRALDYVHGGGVLHRDLKPQNILRTADGVWAISDFGLAREDERQSTALTSTLAQGMGTYIYASPDQWRDPKNAEVRDDIYSMGKVLQHAVTGHLPLDHAADMSPGPLRPVIQRATGPRANRYASSQELLAAVEQAILLYKPSWENPEDRRRRLLPRITGPVADPVALDEMLDWLQSNEIDSEINDLLNAGYLLAACPPASISYLWSTNPDGFRRAFTGPFSTWLSYSSFSFEYCDSIADFAARSVGITADLEIMRHTILRLTRLGTAHNRWHVRDVVVEILQMIRDHDRAVVALEALQAADPSDVRWTVNDFVVRSLHPVLRDGLQPVLRQAS